MPGEQLVCLLPAIQAIMQKEESSFHRTSGIPVHGFKTLLGQLSLLLHHSFSTSLDEKGELTFIECKHTIEKCSILDGRRTFHDRIEEACFGICKEAYRFEMSEENIRRLWRIANRLTDEGTYPPKIPIQNAVWIFTVFEKGRSRIKQDLMKTNGLDFEEFICTLVDICLHELTTGEVDSTINQIYKFLVLEYIKSGWSYKRTKHKRDIDWSNWTRRWLVLKSDGMEFFSHNAVSRRTKSAEKVDIGMNSNTSDLPCYRGSVHGSRYRFKVTDGRMTECEIALENEEDKNKWMTCINHVRSSIRLNTNPVTGLFECMNSGVDHGVTTISDLYNLSLNSTDGLERGHQKNYHRLGNASLQNGAEKGTKNDSMDEKMKIKSLFLDIDSNGNQEISMDDIQSFADKYEIRADEARNIFRICDKDRNGKIDIEEFENFFKRYVLNGKRSGKFISVFRNTFNRERRIGSASLKCKEFVAHMYRRQHSTRTSQIFHGLEELRKVKRDEITKDEFAEFLLNVNTQHVESLSDVELFDALRQKLSVVYDKEEANELTKYVQNRWKMFLKFRRKGISGKVVMTCGHGTVEDLIPGSYNLNGLATFSDLPPLIPKYTFVRKVTWETSPDPSCPGQLIFPSSFNQEIKIEMATNEYLNFYGCRFADSSETEISLDRKHWIQDFHYHKGYLTEYVGAVRGGSTLERHGFAHLDCPLDEISGYFILGKMTEDNDLYLTAFKIPLRHTLYVPPDCIHTNDYLKGTWRTMLADEAHIDDVFLSRRTKNGELEKFSFSFRR